MKRLMMTLALAALASPVCAADVGASISIAQPGLYGRIDIGDYPPPQVIYSRPVAARYVDMDRRPIYLHVPPGHAKNWRKHCAEYNACGERVMFVRNDWYQREYAPRLEERQAARRDERRDEFRPGRPDMRYDDQGRHGGDRGRDH